ncbi:MAG: M14 family zinc carboxypeptidase [Thermaerobacter sp.]|nr:hypothetical protein [Bacillota bacterium]REJ37862.1 MAG: hypothetical protein DIU84_02980 [Bacillota bacterium]
MSDVRTQAWFRNALEAVPDYPEFLTVDELDASTRALAEAHPDLVQVRVIGRSRSGRPIPMLRIGSGRRRALLFGCPHPNEPIGAMMLEYLSGRLCADAGLRRALDWTFYIIKCIDVDGTRLNEGWFKGTFTTGRYIRNFYRPAFHEQVEWTFPVEYKTYRFDAPLPETRALMAAIEEIRPDFIYSLHNAALGGAFYYSSHALTDDLYESLRRLPRERGLPLHAGEPEMPFVEPLSEAVYRLPTLVDQYEFMARVQPGQDPAASLRSGACSVEYARRFCDPVALVTELPYVVDPRINDPTPVDITRRRLLQDGLARDEEILTLLQDLYRRARPHLSVPTPFETAVQDLLRFLEGSLPARRRWLESAPDLDQPATTAQWFDVQVLLPFYRVLYYGMLIRCAAAQPPHPDLDQVAAEAEAAVQRWEAYLDSHLRAAVVPIRHLVQVQLGAGLLVMDYLQAR